MKQTIKLVMLAIMLVLTLSVLAQAQSITVGLPSKQDPPGGPSTISITVGDMTGRGVFSYDFDLMFNQAVLQPQTTPYDANGTLSSGLSVTFNSSTPNHLIINVFSSSNEIAGQGVLLNLKFNVVGGAGTQTSLTWAAFQFNEGDPADNSINGQFTAGSPTASNGVVAGRIVDQSGNPVEGAVVRLEGTQNRKFITDANGSYRFENVETSGFYTVMPSRANYSFNPSIRSFSQLGETTEATFGATFNGENANPLDTPEYFVRQHYLDFLNREPDESGFNFWSDQIIECGADTACSERRRINVSAAYFLSIEFQQTGFLVYRMYQAAYGNLPGTPVPVRIDEFLADTRQLGQGVIVKRQGSEQKLENNKLAFANEFVSRTRFAGLYAGLSDAEFVAALNRNADGVLSPAEQDALAGELSSGIKTRAQVLLAVAENDALARVQFNKAFVLMQYFGYLRRDPDESGYAFWLNKLNQFGGNFEQAEMVKAFIVSDEYRHRFR